MAYDKYKLVLLTMNRTIVEGEWIFVLFHLYILIHSHLTLSLNTGLSVIRWRDFAEPVRSQFCINERSLIGNGHARPDTY